MKRNSSNLVLLLCVWLAGSLGTVWAVGASVATIESAPIVLDLRPTEDATLPFRGTFRISPKAVGNGTAATLLVDGKAAAGWSRTKPMYDSTKLADGWHEFTLKEGDATSTVWIWVLNDPKYVFHEGVVRGNEIWGADRVHLVHGWLSISGSSQVLLAEDAKVLLAEHVGFVDDKQPSKVGKAIITRLLHPWLPVGYQAARPMEIGLRNVTVVPRWPWNGLVDITYWVEYNGTRANSIELWTRANGWDFVRNQKVPMRTISGDGVDRPVAVGGPYMITWDAGKDLDTKFNTVDFAVMLQLQSDYLAVDLSGGPETQCYPVQCHEVGPNVAEDEDALTTELWLKRVSQNSYEPIFAITEEQMAQIGGSVAKIFNAIENKNGLSITGEWWNGSVRSEALPKSEGIQCVSAELDLRPTEDSSLPYRGTLRVSPVAEEARNDAVLTVDGEVAEGWSVTEPLFDSTQLADGWHEFTLQEGDESFTVRIWVLNDPKYVFHEGIVEEDETWGTDQVHLVHGWLSIPEDAQVVIADGAKVLYASETGYAGGRKPSSQGSPIVMKLADLWLDGRTTVLETTSTEHEERLSVVEVTLQKRFVPEAGEIVGGDTLASGSTRVYVFLITMAEGSRFTTVPEWSVEGENPEVASVDPAGNLTALYCERETEVELCATFAVDEESEPVTVRKTVVIQPSNIVPTTFALRKGWNLLACPFGRLTERSRADLLERFQPYHYDADTQSYVMSDGMEYNDSIWLHADSDETIVLDLMTN